MAALWNTMSQHLAWGHLKIRSLLWTGQRNLDEEARASPRQGFLYPEEMAGDPEGGYTSDIVKQGLSKEPGASHNILD